MRSKDKEEVGRGSRDETGWQGKKKEVVPQRAVGPGSQRGKGKSDG
jgi:hypothetical protein